MKVGRFTISLLTILAIALISTVAVAFAAAYVIISWTTTAIVVANPAVCFVKWSDGSKVNTFDYAVNIFPSIKTIDENITYGIWNWNETSRTAYLRWTSLTSSSNIASLNITVYNSTNTIYTKYWSSVPSFPTAWESFTAAGSTKYTIWMEITATAGATGSSVFTFELKVENP
jgi:hypothetical protein